MGLGLGLGHSQCLSPHVSVMLSERPAGQHNELVIAIGPLEAMKAFWKLPSSRAITRHRLPEFMHVSKSAAPARALIPQSCSDAGQMPGPQAAQLSRYCIGPMFKLVAKSCRQMQVTPAAFKSSIVFVPCFWRVQRLDMIHKASTKQSPPPFISCGQRSPPITTNPAEAATILELGIHTRPL